MIKIFIALLLLTLSPFLKAEPIQCKRTDEGVIQLLKNPGNRLSFKNKGGLGNGGVCWWHSRFERAASYLAAFDPSLAKPTKSELYDLLRDITLMKPVTIPGYSNLFEVSSENVPLFQKILNHWQARDAFINQAWTRGLKGSVHMDADKLHAHMNQIFDQFQKKRKPYFLMLQMPSVVAHAYLLLDMIKTETGYEMYVVDSNFPLKVVTQIYNIGDETLIYGNKSMIDMIGDPFIPYLGFARDYKKMERELSDFCHKI
ncbi:MAG: hypothetical protein ACOYL6_13360 [Bacteriovoracaceae bacterium]